MAPPSLPPSTLVFDSRTQIIDNCEFLISKDDIVQVITSKDPADKFFKAYAVRCSEDTREVVLASEPCENAQKAVESLHTKSCEAIHNYTAANGFASPRDCKIAALLEPGLEDDDAASVISGHSDSSTAAFSEWGSSGDEATKLQHATGTNGAPKDRPHPASRQGNRAAPAVAAREPVGGSRSRAAVRDFPGYTSAPPPRARAVRPARSRSPSFAFRQAPPPPPPGHPAHPSSDGPPAPPPSMRGIAMAPLQHPYSSGVTIGTQPPRPPNGMNPSMLPAQPFACFRPPGASVDGPPFPATQASHRHPKPPGPSINNGSSANRHSNGNIINPPRTFPVFHPGMRVQTVRLTVKWQGHGQHRIIAQCQPTRESLQSAALSDVRLHPNAFTNKAPNTASRNSNNRDSASPTLRAQVRQVVLNGEPYDMRAFHGHDLTRLFQAMTTEDSMPSFEVVVEDTYSDSDDDNDDDDDDDATVQGPSDVMKPERWD